MSEETGEKVEEATPQKLKQAKERGQVPKSQDFANALGSAAGVGGAMTLLWVGFEEMRAFWQRTAVTAAQPELSEDNWNALLTDAINVVLKLSLPIGATVMVVGILGHTLQTGLFISPQVLEPKLEKLSPINGFKNLFKLKKLWELGKNLFKVGAAAGLAYVLMKNATHDISLTVSLPLNQAIGYGSQLLRSYFLNTLALFILIGGIDLLWSRREFFREQRMSKQEVKQEYKQQEGDPQVKGQRRQLAHEILFSGGEAAVKEANAIVVNPTHIAAAIRYEEGVDGAPRLVAKGTEAQAERIKALARKHHVPIIRNVTLARALHQIDVDEEIPEELFEAVAEVLAYVYRIQQSSGGSPPGRPDAH